MDIDFSKYPTASAVPEASSMIETFRAVGYNIESAISDIIDNSISANAKNIWVNFEWKGSETSISIKDDGMGMNNDELIQAMRQGSKNPLASRNPEDLGRFGLGLKTASFSQCRRLSVLSKKEGYKPVFWTWDLDFVNQSGNWNLIKYLPDGYYDKKLNKIKSGTIVIWNNIDRLVKSFKSEDPAALNKFMEIMEKVRKHISMVFYRFIEKGKIKLYFCDRLIEPWNPFLTNQPGTQIFPEECLQNNHIIVKGYVLPHKSKIAADIFKIAEGTNGWNDHQGFYIFRNERLILAGNWLGLFRKEEHYKLARIEINIPNYLDSEWQIDIKKSIAQPPLLLRDQLKAYATKVRAQAVEVYRHRGKNVKYNSGQKFIPFWINHKRGDKWFFKINREHPLIELIKKQLALEPEKAIEKLFRFIEETIPAKSIYIKEAEDSETIGNPFEGVDQEPIRILMKQIYNKLIADGKSDENAKSIIINIEPFNHYPQFIEFLN